MKNFKIQAVVDESSLYALIKSGILPTNIEPQNIEWKVGEGFNDGDKTVIPIYAVGYKDTSLKCRVSDEEIRQALERTLSRRLSDLCAEQSYTDSCCCPVLEIQSDPFPDGTPVLRKE